MSVKVENLCKSFSQGGLEIEVLKNLSFQVKTGEIVAILGQSGSGKSTLLSLLSGLDRASSGQVQVDGQSIEAMSENEITDFRGRHIGIVFQQFHLIPHLTAIENVMLPLEIQEAKGFDSQKTYEKAKILLDQVGLSHRIDHFPRQMSGGECQRVAIARAMISSPRFILADEPSGNLDVDTGKNVIDNLFKVVRENKVTMILVTHSMELAQKCDRQLHLSKGQIS